MSTQTKLVGPEIRLDGKSDNSEDTTHKNVSEYLSFPLSQNLVNRHQCNEVQIIKPCGNEDKIIVDSNVPDVDERHKPETITKSPQLQITKFTDHSLIYDFDALEDNFDK